MGVDFGVIWAADFNNVIRFYVRRPARRRRVTRRHNKILKSERCNGMRINWPLISILPLDSCSPIRPALKGHSPPAVTTKMTDIDLGIDDGVIWAANFNTDIRFDKIW